MSTTIYMLMLLPLCRYAVDTNWDLSKFLFARNNFQLYGPYVSRLPGYTREYWWYWKLLRCKQELSLNPGFVPQS